MASDAESQLEYILNVLRHLNAGNFETALTPSGNDDDLNEINIELSVLAKTLSERPESTDQDGLRTAELMDGLIAIANLDFSRALPVSDTGDVYDALAVGINALGEELFESTVSRDFLESLIDSMMDALMVIDSDAIIRMVNPAALRLLGWREEALVGQPVASILGEDLSKNTALLMNRVVETDLVTREGTAVPVSLSRSLLPEHTGNFPAGMVLVARDITERKQAEEALLASEKRYRNVVEDLPVLICRFQSDGILTFVNRRYCEYFDKPREELEGQNFFQFIPEADRESVHQHYSSLTQDNPIVSYEHEVFTPDGIRGWQRWIDRALFNKDGQIFEYQSIGEDVTERKQAELEIHRLNAELEQRVIERTHQLQMANQELESFAYSVSHDLRAPLRAIDGFSQALLEDYHHQLDAEGQDYLQRVRAGSQRMGQLIDDILTLSRVTRQELRRQAVDLSVQAQDIVAELRRMQPERRVEVKIDEGIVARGDGTLLRVVLQNLLENAWKFTSKRNNAQITFKASIQGNEHVISVSDNGAGFNMRYADKLFGAFQRLHHANEFKGTGIGLATVQRIIHRHGGRVWAEAEVDKGATFYFTLPLE